MDLKEFFNRYPKTAVAFSGGADSAYLLYAARQYGLETRAYYVKTAFQPAFALRDALRLAEELQVPLRVLELEILADAAIAANPPDRCYHCKRAILQEIKKAAFQDGFSVLLDGANASDAEDSRPGMRALEELSVRSPLRACGLSKPEIRRLSKEAGLFTWDKPAYACLSTRIPAGEPVTLEKLAAAEAAEDYLRSLGFTDFRVRRMNGAAKLQLPENQLSKLLENREKILLKLKPYYTNVLLDLEARNES